MLNFVEIFRLGGPILTIAISIYAIKITENGWKKFWKIVILIAIIVLAYRLVATYFVLQERKQNAINTVCQELLPTYDRTACLKLRN